MQEIDKLLDSDKLPAVVNMSVGTHVGPHNGQSPLEAYISGTLFKPSDRFAFAAAGNEGGKGISARLELKQSAADYMEIIVDPDCTEALVEFWWDDAIPADLEIAARIEGSGFSPITITINPATVAGVTLTPAGASAPMSFLSLLHTTTHGTMSCIAFAATRPPARPGRALPEFRISFDLTAKAADVAVHAWLVICEEALEDALHPGRPGGNGRRARLGPQGRIRGRVRRCAQTNVALLITRASVRLYDGYTHPKPHDGPPLPSPRRWSHRRRHQLREPPRRGGCDCCPCGSNQSRQGH